MSLTAPPKIDSLPTSWYPLCVHRKSDLSDERILACTYTDQQQQYVLRLFQTHEDHSHPLAISISDHTNELCCCFPFEWRVASGNNTYIAADIIDSMGNWKDLQWQQINDTEMLLTNIPDQLTAPGQPKTTMTIPLSIWQAITADLTRLKDTAPDHSSIYFMSEAREVFSQYQRGTFDIVPPLPEATVISLEDTLLTPRIQPGNQPSTDSH